MRPLTLLLAAAGALGCGSGHGREDHQATALTVAEGGISFDSAPRSLAELAQKESAASVLTDIRGVLADADGSIALADAGVPAVYIFSPTGTLQETIGRSGSGPAEFREPTLVAFWSESLAVFDPPQRRLSYFRRDGSLIRQRTISVPGTIAPTILGIRADGAVIYKGTVLKRPADGTTRIDTHALVLAIDAKDAIDTLATIPDGAWLPNGPFWYAWRSAVAVTDSGIWFGSGNTPMIRFQAWSATSSSAFRWDATTRAVNDGDRNAIAALAGARGAAPSLTGPDRFADSVPSFQRLLPDPMGGVWIIGYAAPFAASDSARWVDTTSGTITALALPKGFRPYQFGSDFVLGVQTGEDDGLTVARFGLKR